MRFFVILVSKRRTKMDWTTSYKKQKKTKPNPVEIYYTCTICNRQMEKKAVQLFSNDMLNIINDNLTNKFEHSTHVSEDGKVWICKSCRNSLKKGKIPLKAEISEIQKAKNNFNIRPQKVMSALQWLAENNMHYNSTTIANSESWKNAWNNDNEHFSSLIEGYQAKEHPVEDNIKPGVISDTI